MAGLEQLVSGCSLIIGAVESNFSSWVSLDLLFGGCSMACLAMLGGSPKTHVWGMVLNVTNLRKGQGDVGHGRF